MSQHNKMEYGSGSKDAYVNLSNQFSIISDSPNNVINKDIIKENYSSLPTNNVLGNSFLCGIQSASRNHLDGMCVSSGNNSISMRRKQKRRGDSCRDRRYIIGNNQNLIDNMNVSGKNNDLDLKPIYSDTSDNFREYCTINNVREVNERLISNKFILNEIQATTNTHITVNELNKMKTVNTTGTSFNYSQFSSMPVLTPVDTTKYNNNMRLIKTHNATFVQPESEVKLENVKGLPNYTVSDQNDVLSDKMNSDSQIRENEAIPSDYVCPTACYIPAPISINQNDKSYLGLFNTINQPVQLIPLQSPLLVNNNINPNTRNIVSYPQFYIGQAPMNYINFPNDRSKLLRSDSGVASNSHTDPKIKRMTNMDISDPYIVIKGDAVDSNNLIGFKPQQQFSSNNEVKLNSSVSQDSMTTIAEQLKTDTLASYDSNNIQNQNQSFILSEGNVNVKTVKGKFTIEKVNEYKVLDDSLNMTFNNVADKENTSMEFKSDTNKVQSDSDETTIKPTKSRFKKTRIREKIERWYMDGFSGFDCRFRIIPNKILELSKHNPESILKDINNKEILIEQGDQFYEHQRDYHDKEFHFWYNGVRRNLPGQSIDKNVLCNFHSKFQNVACQNEILCQQQQYDQTDGIDENKDSSVGSQCTPSNSPVRQYRAVLISSPVKESLSSGSSHNRVDESNESVSSYECYSQDDNPMQCDPQLLEQQQQQLQQQAHQILLVSSSPLAASPLSPTYLNTNTATILQHPQLHPPCSASPTAMLMLPCHPGSPSHYHHNFIVHNTSPLPGSCCSEFNATNEQINASFSVSEDQVLNNESISEDNVVEGNAGVRQVTNDQRSSENQNQSVRQQQQQQFSPAQHFILATSATPLTPVISTNPNIINSSSVRTQDFGDSQHMLTGQNAAFATIIGHKNLSSPILISNNTPSISPHTFINLSSPSLLSHDLISGPVNDEIDKSLSLFKSTVLKLFDEEYKKLQQDVFHLTKKNQDLKSELESVKSYCELLETALQKNNSTQQQQQPTQQIPEIPVVQSSSDETQTIAEETINL